MAFLCALCAATAQDVGAQEPEDLLVETLYLRQAVDRPPALSNIMPPAADSGVAGATLGVADSNTTGRFLRQRYRLRQVFVDDVDAALSAAREHVAAGHSTIVTDVPAATLRQLADDSAIAGRSILFNAGAPDDSLRRSSCRTGLLHTLPSRSMLSDALAQFLTSRRWNSWLVLKGGREADQAIAAAYERSAKRFGARIIASKEWSFATDLRRTAQQELPLFTQGGKYDVTLVADEIGDVGEYVPYNTWLPRPVAGTQGLTPTGWHSVVEQWGAQQLQNRFREQSGRPMDDRDYAAWVAMRAIAEAVTRTGVASAEALYAYLLGDEFEIAAFKGRSLSFRPWNGQLRQPIPLVQPRAVVSQAPLSGFLHPRTELDTLGFDEPEVQCNFETSL
ncbi:MAG: ABC transporter substrate-binding protein [Halieaceae bacterium]|nr:ABC transporter substrate-binding protein [Halieaceae bacterium]